MVSTKMCHYFFIWLSALFVIGFRLVTAALPLDNQIPIFQDEGYSDVQKKADAVKEAFSFAWDNYYNLTLKQSKICDEIRPQTGECQNTR